MSALIKRDGLYVVMELILPILNFESEIQHKQSYGTASPLVHTQTNIVDIIDYMLVHRQTILLLSYHHR